MNQSPSTSQLLNNSPELLSNDALFVNSQKNPYHSTISLELRRAEQTNLIGSRVSKFCEQQKLLADKDLRIQELLMEIRSYKDQTSFLISQLQQTVHQLLNNNRFLEDEIADLLKQRNSDKILILEKDKLIEELMSKNISIKDKSQYENFARVENYDEKEEKEQINIIQEESDESSQNIFEQQQQKCTQKHKLTIQKDKQKQLNEFFENVCQLIYPKQQIQKQFKNKSNAIIYELVLKQLIQLKQYNNGMKQLNEKQAINIIDLSKVIQQLIIQRRQILSHRNISNSPKSNSHHQSSTNIIQLFQIQEESNSAITIEQSQIHHGIANNISPSTIQERAQSQEESSQNSVVFDLKVKIDQLQKILDVKNARINELESQYKSYTESFRKIFELSNDFNNTFCPFVERSNKRSGQICERIEKHFKKVEVERKMNILSQNIPNLPANQYCESLIPSTVLSQLI